jgi:hypothetical protein
MKKPVLFTFVVIVAFLFSCNNESADKPVNRDSINNNIDNTKTILDTMTNGDTSSFDRMNEHIPKDSIPI